MMTSANFDAWSAGQNYEHYMGRWSRRIAARYVDWLAAPANADWLEIGCGTGALTEAVLGRGEPHSITATDQSADFVAHARAATTDPRARFEVGDSSRLPASDGSIDVVTSGLVLNFIPDRPAALAEMHRVLKPKGLLSFYVWDYPGGGVGFIDGFWKAAGEIDPRADALNERVRFPFCTGEALAGLCRQAGFEAPLAEPIEIETLFPDFESFWHPFTLGAGPAPGYCASLAAEQRAMLRVRLEQELGTDGPISLAARAWAVKAQRPD
ncbi:MAG: methyltransferase domain-containing protein [Rhodobiaceae bacterium]|nr:methyltransferase domain-containing protein [Rhodobiaceae bacterium]